MVVGDGWTFYQHLTANAVNFDPEVLKAFLKSLGISTRSANRYVKFFFSGDYRKNYRDVPQEDYQRWSKEYEFIDRVEWKGLQAICDIDNGERELL